MATQGFNVFTLLRLLILLALLVLAIFGWRFVQKLGGASNIIPELLRVHEQREASEGVATNARISAAIQKLGIRRSLNDRIAGARVLGKEALARKKSYIQSGLSVSYGLVGAEVRIANDDNSDLYQAANLLAHAVSDKSELLRLEASHALSNMQLNQNHSGLVRDLERALQQEYSVAIKTNLARALGDIGGPAARAGDELMMLLEEDEPRLLASAARALAKIGPVAYSRGIESRLVGLLTNDNGQVRESSAEALGAIGAYSRQAESGLRSALDDRNAYVRAAASLALADIGLADETVIEALAQGFELPPETTLYVDDVARRAHMRARIAKAFAQRGQIPDELVSSLIDMAKRTDNIGHKERLIAMVANTESYSDQRAIALIELLQDPKFGFYYTAVDGLVDMGPEVLPRLEPLLQHQNAQVRQLAQEVQRKLGPKELKAAPVADTSLIAQFENASDSYSRQEIAVTMAKTGNPELLDYLLAHRDERVMNGPVYDVVVNRLIAHLRQYKFSATHDPDSKRLALDALRYLGVLNQVEYDNFRAHVGDVEIGDRVRDIWRQQKRSGPQPSSQADRLKTLYGGMPAPRNQDVQDYAKKLTATDPAVRLEALKGLRRISAHAVEAPAYIERAMKDPNQRVRGQAVDAYVGGGFTTLTSLAALREVLFATDQSDLVNQNAAVGLAQIGPPALDTLQEAAKHEVVAVRRAAVYGLWKMGNAAAPATTLLQQLAKDSHKGVRTYAQSALSDLEGT